MTFDDMVQQVVVITNRPDMTYASAGGTGEIISALQASTHAMHTTDGHFFPSDLVESVVTFLVPAQYSQSIDTTALPLFRKIKYIKKIDDLTQYNYTGLLPPLYNNSANRSKGFLDIIDPDQLFDTIFGLQRQDIAWQAGDALQLRSSTPLTTVRIGWYRFPNITVDMYSSWIARDYPFAIIYAACSTIFASIGQQDQSRKYDGQGGLAADTKAAMIKSSLINAGY